MKIEECKNQLIEIIKSCNLKGLMIKLKNKHKDVFLFVDQFKIDHQLKDNGESIYWILHDIIEKPRCEGISPRCEKPELKFSTIEKGYQKHCIKCCTLTSEYKDKYTRTMIEKYGVTNPQKLDSVKEKTVNTNIERYGHSCPIWSEKGQKKSQDTLLMNYGPDGLGNPLITQRKIETNRKRFGADWALQIEEFQDKRKNTCIENCGSDNWMKSSEGRLTLHNQWIISPNRIEQENKVREFLKARNFTLQKDYVNVKTPLSIKCEKCGNVFEEYWSYDFRISCYCPICEPSFSSRSRAEEEICKLIEAAGIHIVRNSRKIISPYELDIYIPDLKLAIEYSGLRYHSSGGLELDNYIVPYNYHLMKHDRCKELGISLITIFEDEWILKKEIVISRIFSKIKKTTCTVFARKCKIKEISFDDKRSFLDENHLQGNSNSCINLGAYFENMLISVMTFSKLSISKGSNNTDGSFELSRFSNKINYNIPGIASKFLSYFKKNYDWKVIISYADKRWSDGNLYKEIGFQEIQHTAPNYWYWGNDIIGRAHRFRFRKSELKNMSHFRHELSEKEIMKLECYNWIYDCGNLKFVMIK